MEAIVIVLGVAVVPLVVLAVVLSMQRGRHGGDLAALQSLVQGVEAKISESATGVRERFMEDIKGLEKEVSTMSARLDEQRESQKALRESASRIEGVLTGTKKGATGENILGDMLRQLPTSLVECNLSIGGRVVEYAIVLPNKKKLALDCKFPASDLLEQMASDGNGSDPAILHREMEKRVMSQVENVRRYIDPSQTMDFALMAVPDSAFGMLSVQRLYEAYRRSVLILSYSMTVPYLLSLYQLCLQYATQIDAGSIMSALEGIERYSRDIRDELENKISRGYTMIGNGYSQITGLVGRIESDVQRLRVVSSERESEE